MLGAVPESFHSTEIVPAVTSEPAAGAVISTSARTKGTRAAKSQDGLGIIVWNAGGGRC